MRAPLLALAIAILGLGCDPGAPNGKHRVLFFRPEFASLGQGLAETIRLPDHVVLGGGPKSFSKSETYDYDFDGTALEATADPGVEVLGAALDADGWAVRIRCDAPDRRAVELRVRVLEAGAARYEDAFDLACTPPARLDIVKPAAPQRCAVGARVLVANALHAADGARLDGHGVGLADPGAAALAVDAGQADTAFGQAWMTAVRPGPPPLLAAGPITAPVPVEVLDASTWAPSLEAAAGAGGIAFTAGARDGAGAALGCVYGCTVILETGGGTSRQDACEGTFPGATSGRLCATVLGETTCRDL